MGEMFHFSSGMNINELIREQLPKDKNDIKYNFGNLKLKGEIYNGPIWYSFDSNSLNYHITPKKEDIEDYLKECSNYRTDIWKKLEPRENELGIKVKGKQDRWGKGKDPWTECHRWVEVTKNGFSYLLCFQTLYCTEDNLVSCDFGKIQFQKFPEKNDGPNRDSNGSFTMMYPSDGDKAEKTENGICIRNTCFFVGDEISEIIDEFVSFIGRKSKVE